VELFVFIIKYWITKYLLEEEKILIVEKGYFDEFGVN
jgi:hypothetical protein